MWSIAGWLIQPDPIVHRVERGEQQVAALPVGVAADDVVHVAYRVPGRAPSSIAARSASLGAMPRVFTSMRVPPASTCRHPNSSPIEPTIVPVDADASGVGGTCELVDAQSGAIGVRVVAQAGVELDARPVGDTHQSVEHGDRGGRLDHAICPDRGDQRLACRAELPGRRPLRLVRERQQFGAVFDADIADEVGVDDQFHVDLDVEGVAAHTEQRCVGRRSIEALVQPGGSGGDEFDLRAVERAVPDRDP